MGGPDFLTEWRYRLIVPFRGALYRVVNGCVTHHHLVSYLKSYAYTQHDSGGDWIPLGDEMVRTIAAVIFY